MNRNSTTDGVVIHGSLGDESQGVLHLLLKLQGPGLAQLPRLHMLLIYFLLFSNIIKRPGK